MSARALGASVKHRRLTLASPCEKAYEAWIQTAQGCNDHCRHEGDRLAADIAARELKISRDTARNQLKSIFAKTDTHRQSQPEKTASSLPLVDDLAQTGDDSPQFSPRFWACRFGIADGRKSPFDCRLVCVRTRPLVCD
jgi:hypothetical protein